MRYAQHRRSRSVCIVSRCQPSRRHLCRNCVCGVVLRDFSRASCAALQPAAAAPANSSSLFVSRTRACSHDATRRTNTVHPPVTHRSLCGTVVVCLCVNSSGPVRFGCCFGGAKHFVARIFGSVGVSARAYATPDFPRVSCEWCVFREFSDRQHNRIQKECFACTYMLYYIV